MSIIDAISATSIEQPNKMTDNGDFYNKKNHEWSHPINIDVLYL